GWREPTSGVASRRTQARAEPRRSVVARPRTAFQASFVNTSQPNGAFQRRGSPGSISPVPQPWEGRDVKLDKQFALDELRKEGQSQKIQEAIQKLPEKVDHEQHAALLQKLGLDPG